MRAFLHNRLGRFIQSRTLQVHAHRRTVQVLPKSRAAATIRSCAPLYTTCLGARTLRHRFRTGDRNHSPTRNKKGPAQTASGYTPLPLFGQCRRLGNVKCMIGNHRSTDGQRPLPRSGCRITAIPMATRDPLLSIVIAESGRSHPSLDRPARSHKETAAER